MRQPVLQPPATAPRLSRKERKQAERDARRDAYADVMNGRIPYANYPPPGSYPTPSSSAGTPRIPVPMTDYGFPAAANNGSGPSSLSGTRVGSSSSQGLSPDQEIKKWLDMCKKAKGQVEMLHEALVYATPDDLKGDFIMEFYEACKKNQNRILEHLVKATADAELSRRNARSPEPTLEEHLVEELLKVHEQILDVLKIYDELEQVGVETQAIQRLQTERMMEIVSAIGNYTPTQEEDALVAQVFARGDPQGTGLVRTSEAEQALFRSRLSPIVLEQIWDIANIEDRDAIGRQQVGTAFRLAGQAQAGTPISEHLILRSGPAPYLEGISPLHTCNKVVEISGFPAVTPEDRKKFVRIFNSGHPVNGFINASAAGDLFSKSQLPRDTLAKIWDFADTANNGHFDIPRFSIAMYLIQACMSRYFATVPSTLPLAIYDAFGAPPPKTAHLPPPILSHRTSYSSRSTPSRTPSITRSVLESSLLDLGDALPAMTPTSPTSPGGSHFVFGGPSRYSAASPDPFRDPPKRTPSISRSPPLSPFTSYNSLANSPAIAGAMLRAVSEEERARVDGYFDSLDAGAKGWIGADVAVPFFERSRLPDSVMADIWDMADTDRNGRLSRDEFALAMHLVMKALRGENLATPAAPMVPPVPAAAQPDHAHVAPLTERDRDRDLPLPARPMSTASTAHQSPQPIATTPAPQAEILLQEPETIHVVPEEEERSDTPPPPYTLVPGEGEDSVRTT